MVDVLVEAWWVEGQGQDREGWDSRDIYEWVRLSPNTRLDSSYGVRVVILGLRSGWG